MWSLILERITPSMTEVVCIGLAFFIPFGVYKINQHLHKDMDPPWKKEEKQQS